MSLAGTDELLKAIKGSKQRQLLVAEKLAQFDTFLSFLESNPDVEARYKVHKTYEILKNDTRD